MPASRPVAPSAASRWRLPASAAVAALTLGFAASSRPASSQEFEPPCAVETSERVVAIGDIHGAYGRFVETLERAGLVDGRQRWIGDRAVLVQTGDVLDRGPESRRVLDLLRRLQGEAARAGGQVHALLGNHEVMRMIGAWADVNADEYDAFRDFNSEDVRERAYEVVSDRLEREARDASRGHDEIAFRRQFLLEVPLGFIEMRRAFATGGEYGRWLRRRPAVARINGVVYLHGGLSEKYAALGCDGLNRAIHREVVDVSPERVPPDMLSNREDGPLWYRGLALEPEDTFAPALASILVRMEARAIVIGHTTALGRVYPRFGGRVILIDTGMLGGKVFPGGVASALEIHGSAVTAIYPDRREILSLPAFETAAR